MASMMITNNWEYSKVEVVVIIDKENNHWYNVADIFKNLNKNHANCHAALLEYFAENISLTKI